MAFEFDENAFIFRIFKQGLDKAEFYQLGHILLIRSKSKVFDSELISTFEIILYRKENIQLFGLCMNRAIRFESS